MRYILALLFTLATFPAFAQKAQPQVVSNNFPGTVVTAVALSTSPVSSEMDVDGYALLKLQVQFTRAGAATDIGFTCEEADTSTGTWSKITKTSSSDAVTEFHPLYTTSASVNWTVRLDVTGFILVRCTFTGTAAAAGDVVTVATRRARGI